MEKMASRGVILLEVGCKTQEKKKKINDDVRP